MAKRTSRFAKMGLIKRSTNDIVEESLEQQAEWLNRKKDTSLLSPAVSKKSKGSELKKTGVTFTRDTKPAPRIAAAQPLRSERNKMAVKTIRYYWFPILCAVAVMLMLIYVLFIPRCTGNAKPDSSGNTVSNTMVIDQTIVPSFDIVRISKQGKLTVAGRWLPMQSVSVIINGKVVATEMTNATGEFAYAPSKEFAPGNYTIRLYAIGKDIKSVQDVFVYVSPRGEKSSLSLLMTKDGSRLLQSPRTSSGDLVVSKIDYLSNGRIFVQGSALPRLRVTLTLDGKELGFARVSDHKNFGLGADVEKLEPGREYKLAVRMHDGDGSVVSEFKHVFKMPEMTPGDETYYTVRRGDALWIIARNFFGRGVMYSMIVEKNNIKNPDLIYPAQVLQIPITAK